MLIAQITDCHIVEPGLLFNDRLDTAAGLGAAVTHLNTMSPRPDVVLATGDLVNDGRPAQYAELAVILAELEMPLLPIPGNHDDRTELRATFPDAVPAGSADDRIDYVVDSWPVRFIGLDTIVPGYNHGLVTPDQMAWLDQTLSHEPERPTLIFQHHPPFLTAIEWMDEYGLTGRELEADVVSRHAQVLGVVCGHIHRSIQTRFGNTVASTWPSTCAQIALALDGARHGYADESPAVALHKWIPGEGLVSHLSFIEATTHWIPAWAADADSQPGGG